MFPCRCYSSSYIAFTEYMCLKCNKNEQSESKVQREFSRENFVKSIPQCSLPDGSRFSKIKLDKKALIERLEGNGLSTCWPSNINDTDSFWHLEEGAIVTPNLYYFLNNYIRRKPLEMKNSSSNVSHSCSTEISPQFIENKSNCPDVDLASNRKITKTIKRVDPRKHNIKVVTEECQDQSIKHRYSNEQSHNTNNQNRILKQIICSSQKDPESVHYNDPLKHKRCLLFLRGMPCSRDCRFIHAYPKDDEIICKHFNSSTSCKWQDKGHYLHKRIESSNPEIKSSYTTLDPNLGKRCSTMLKYGSCRDYQCPLIHRFPRKDGIYCKNENNCKYGTKCQYLHKEISYKKRAADKSPNSSSPSDSRNVDRNNCSKMLNLTISNDLTLGKENSKSYRIKKKEKSISPPDESPSETALGNPVSNAGDELSLNNNALQSNKNDVAKPIDSDDESSRDSCRTQVFVNEDNDPSDMSISDFISFMRAKVSNLEPNDSNSDNKTNSIDRLFPDASCKDLLDNNVTAVDIVSKSGNYSLPRNQGEDAKSVDSNDETLQFRGSSNIYGDYNESSSESDDEKPLYSGLGGFLSLLKTKTNSESAKSISVKTTLTDNSSANTSYHDSLLNLSPNGVTDSLDIAKTSHNNISNSISTPSTSNDNLKYSNTRISSITNKSNSTGHKTLSETSQFRGSSDMYGDDNDSSGESDDEKPLYSGLGNFLSLIKTKTNSESAKSISVKTKLTDNSSADASYHDSLLNLSTNGVTDSLDIAKTLRISNSISTPSTSNDKRNCLNIYSVNNKSKSTGPKTLSAATKYINPQNQNLIPVHTDNPNSKDKRQPNITTDKSKEESIGSVNKDNNFNEPTDNKVNSLIDSTFKIIPNKSKEFSFVCVKNSRNTSSIKQKRLLKDLKIPKKVPPTNLNCELSKSSHGKLCNNSKYQNKPGSEIDKLSKTDKRASNSKITKLSATKSQIKNGLSKLSKTNVSSISTDCSYLPKSSVRKKISDSTILSNLNFPDSTTKISNSNHSSHSKMLDGENVSTAINNIFVTDRVMRVRKRKRVVDSSSDNLSDTQVSRNKKKLPDRRKRKYRNSHDEKGTQKRKKATSQLENKVEDTPLNVIISLRENKKFRIKSPVKNTLTRGKENVSEPLLSSSNNDIEVIREVTHFTKEQSEILDTAKIFLTLLKITDFDRNNIFAKFADLCSLHNVENIEREDSIQTLDRNIRRFATHWFLEHFPDAKIPTIRFDNPLTKYLDTLDLNTPPNFRETQ